MVSSSVDGPVLENARSEGGCGGGNGSNSGGTIVVYLLNLDRRNAHQLILIEQRGWRRRRDYRLLCPVGAW